MPTSIESPPACDVLGAQLVIKHGSRRKIPTEAKDFNPFLFLDHEHSKLDVQAK